MWIAVVFERGGKSRFGRDQVEGLGRVEILGALLEGS